MQGGADESLVHLRSAADALKCCERPAKNKEKEDHVTPPIDTLTVASEILISPVADALLLKAREWFALALATPLAWLHLDESVAACRERKHERVREGAAVVVAIQNRCRSPWRDFYFSCCSFCAEEEFYLLVLPIFFWNIDYRLARHMTLVVNLGLLVGNLMKDVFRLPRPKHVEAKVWVPHSATQIDSTGCRDFGFPSTHAMNAVSNAGLFALYCVRHGCGGKPINHIVLFVGTVMWIVSITFGRLYLGVHSPMDVKGGMLLGCALIVVFQQPLHLLDYIDNWTLELPHVGALLLVFFTLVLILNPQPRPMTPTFMQNCVVTGLTWGCIVGFRMETDRRHGRGILGLSSTPVQDGVAKTGSAEMGLGFAVIRTVIGYAIVMVTRIVLKGLLCSLFRKIGLEPSPAKPVPRKGSESEGREKQPELKGWDLFAAALVKTVVYAALALSITCACPALFEFIGLPCEMNG